MRAALVQTDQGTGKWTKVIRSEGRGMKTSAVTVLVCGMVSLVGGVVALTVPYMGYPWLRHSGRWRK